MSTKYTGGPAFPTYESNGDGHLYCSGPGMSLREYFIAHAPSEPQPWFQPNTPPSPVSPAYPDGMTDDEHTDFIGLSDWLDIKDLTQPRVIKYAHEQKAYLKAVSQWNQMREKARYIQWPAAWADAMLEASHA